MTYSIAGPWPIKGWRAGVKGRAELLVELSVLVLMLVLVLNVGVGVVVAGRGKGDTLLKS